MNDFDYPSWWDIEDAREYDHCVVLFMRAISLRADAGDDEDDDRERAEMRVPRGATLH